MGKMLQKKNLSSIILKIYPTSLGIEPLMLTDKCCLETLFQTEFLFLNFKL